VRLLFELLAESARPNGEVRFDVAMKCRAPAHKSGFSSSWFGYTLYARSLEWHTQGAPKNKKEKSDVPTYLPFLRFFEIFRSDFRTYFYSAFGLLMQKRKCFSQLFRPKVFDMPWGRFAETELAKFGFGNKPG
jgi:hypothetical protein